jgi:hypothetical protein
MKIIEERVLERDWLKQLVEVAVEKKCDKTVLNTSEQNAKFYNKIGFQKNEIQMIIRN